MTKRTALIIPALALFLLFSCQNTGREGAHQPGGTLQSFGETVVHALGNGDGHAFNESACLSLEEFNDLLLTLEMVPAEEKKRTHSDMPLYWERSSIEEKRLAAWNEAYTAGTAEGVDWDTLQFKSVRHQPLDGAHRLDRFFVTLIHLKTKPADVYVVFSDGRNRSFEVHLDDCIETPNGWRSASGIRWRGSLEAMGRADCIRNLRNIDSAKLQLSIDSGLGDGIRIKPGQLAGYLKPHKGVDPLQCPLGGEYSINDTGIFPSCSLHGSVDEPQE